MKPSKWVISEQRQADAFSEALNAINQLLLSTLHFEEIMQGTVSAAARTLGSETAAISLRQGKRWVVSYVHGFPQSILGTEMSDEEEPHALLAITTHRPVAVDDAFSDPRVNREHMRKWNVRSVLVVPLLAKGEVVGVMFFNYSRAACSFRSSHIDFATKLASSLSLAVENARLFQAVQRQLTERTAAEAEARAAKEALAQANANLEEAVQERTAKLKEMVTELEHVSYAIVHDMRAPLRAMNTFAHLLAEEIPAGRQQVKAREYCRRILLGASRLDKLITDALSYTRAVLQDLPLEPVDLSHLIQGLVDTYPNLHADKADIRVEGDFPPVLGNESLLTQCFSNLLGNAVKFVAPGTRPQVRVWAEEVRGVAASRKRLEPVMNGLSKPPAGRSKAPGADGGTSLPPASDDSVSFPMVRLWVEDNGIGIPKIAQRRLFGIFQKLDSQYEGTGTGLAIVRKVVERMGGGVGVESELGKGSRFWVELRRYSPRPSKGTAADQGT